MSRSGFPLLRSGVFFHIPPMLRRTRVSRLLAAVLAVWLAAITVEPTALHVCAMHPDGAMAPSSAGLSAPSVLQTHGDMLASHGAHPATDADATTPGAGHACTCLGQCCGASPMALGDYGPVLRFAATVAPPRPGYSAHERVVAWEDFLLPFGTAPPISARA